MIKFFSLFCIAISLYSVDLEYRGENSQFIINNKTFETLDYNRFRSSLYIDSEHISFTSMIDINSFIAKKSVISLQDNIDFSVDVPFDTVSKNSVSDRTLAYASIYRLNGVYENASRRVSIGLLRVPFGVGRIFTPVDIYNPYQALALEPSQRQGVFGLYYTYAVGELSTIDMIVTSNKKKESKMGIRLKSTLKETDVALVAVDDKQLSMYGYEIEGDFNGMGWRSEAGLFKEKNQDITYQNSMFGVDYGFASGFMMIVEYYNRAKEISNIDKSYLGDTYIALNLSDTLTPLLSVNTVFMQNLEDESKFVGPSFTYSLSDEMTMLLGALVGFGNESSEFKRQGESYYFSWQASF
jgi:hypothetical protein